MTSLSVTTNKLPFPCQTSFRRSCQPLASSKHLVSLAVVGGAPNPRLGWREMTATISPAGRQPFLMGFMEKQRKEIRNCENRGRKVKFNLDGSAHTAPGGRGEGAVSRYTEEREEEEETVPGDRHMKRVPQRKGALLPVYSQVNKKSRAGGCWGAETQVTLTRAPAAFLHVRPAVTESNNDTSILRLPA